MIDFALAFQNSLDLHTAEIGLEPKHPDGTYLFHLLVSALEWCDQKNVDFDAVLVQARGFHEREE